MSISTMMPRPWKPALLSAAAGEWWGHLSGSYVLRAISQACHRSGWRQNTSPICTPAGQKRDWGDSSVPPPNQSLFYCVAYGTYGACAPESYSYQEIVSALLHSGHQILLSHAGQAMCGVSPLAAGEGAWSFCSRDGTLETLPSLLSWL